MSRTLRVTTWFLEMNSLDEFRPTRSDPLPYEFEKISPPDFRINRAAYFEIGGPWHWKDKRLWVEDRWKIYVASPSLYTFVARSEGRCIGYFELNQKKDGTVKIEYFGLHQDFVGRGWGKLFLTQAVEAAWALGGTAVRVNTCSLDHPHALANYQARGFKIVDVLTGERTLPSVPS